MQFKIQLVMADEAGGAGTVQEITVLDKDFHNMEQLGLTLDESKTILKEVQQAIVEKQTQAYLETRACCEACGTRLKKKGYHRITFRTLFGNSILRSPRLHRCPCQLDSQETVTFSPLAELLSERTAPELLFMETKWASLISYGMTVKVFKDFLPLDEKLNSATVRNHATAVAQRSEAVLGEERVMFIDGCPRDWNALPPPGPPITIGIDGGYLRQWKNKATNFEVIVGKCIPEQGPAKCFGFAQAYDRGLLLDEHLER